MRFINITKAGGVEEEFIKISEKYNVNITLGFNESIADFDKVASSSFSCENIKCLNSNFKKTISVLIIVIVVLIVVQMLSQNAYGAECLADVSKDYEPKCL